MAQQSDVVYILGRGSFWANNEFRYSLRSIEAYLQGMGKVYVVGDRPDWLTGVEHFPYPDKYACKERNIMEKVAYICGHPDLSDDFLSMHDDHFCLAPQLASEIPFWRSTGLRKLADAVMHSNPGNTWWKSVRNTSDALLARGLTEYNFDLHYPILLNKNLYPAIMDEYDWRGQEHGFVVKSIYCNTLRIPGTFSYDLKLQDRLDFPGLVARFSGRPWFSIGNAGLNRNLKALFAELYPVKSRFEK